MTQLEILKLALCGINLKMNREEEISAATKTERGRENEINIHRLETYRHQFDEINALIFKEENKSQTL